MRRGEFVDIHDIGGVDPQDYDVLITDLNHEKLESEISELVGIPFLKEATKDEAETVAKKIHGFIYGRRFRLILPCVLTTNDMSRWVFFIVDSGAPLTYISSQGGVHLCRKKYLPADLISRWQNPSGSKQRRTLGLPKLLDTRTRFIFCRKTHTLLPSTFLEVTSAP